MLPLVGMVVRASVYVTSHRLLGVVRRRDRAGADERARRFFRAWCAATCRSLKIRLCVRGEVPEGPCIFVANHRTYLDIPVLGSVIDAGFLGRADIAEWPLVGYAARALDCVFVERDSVHGRSRAARALLRGNRRRRLIVFPEGTTRGERLPGKIPEGLARLLGRLDLPVVPVTLRYDRRDIYWLEDMGMVEHLRAKVLRGGRTTCLVDIGPPIQAAALGLDLAEAIHAEMCRPIEERGELCTSSETATR